MYKVAITGGIGSGKSTVSNILRDLGAIVLSCDDINREMLSDTTYLAKMKEIFPNEIKGNIIDKKAIREIISYSQDKRLKLNKLAHSEIKSRLLAKINRLKDKIVFCEVPLLFEANMQGDFDEIWLVVADKNIRANRVSVRDNTSIESSYNIINTQAEVCDIISKCDSVIQNDGNMQILREIIVAKYTNLLKNI